jgi:hypothetical protein
LRVIDPLGLKGIDGYLTCLMARARGHEPPNCEQQLHAQAEDAAGEMLESACEFVFEGVKCTAICSLKQVFGADVEEFAIKAHKEAAKKALEKVAKETASKFAKKLIPGYFHYDTASDVFGTATCTVDCVKQ